MAFGGAFDPKPAKKPRPKKAGGFGSAFDKPAPKQKKDAGEKR